MSLPPAFPDPTLANQQAVDELHRQLPEFEIFPLDRVMPTEVPVSRLRRSRRLFPDDDIGLATLVEVNGVWFWQEGIVTQGISSRRAAFGLTTVFGGTPLTTVKFERLGSNQIAAKLEELDQKFTPEVSRALGNKENNPGLREFKNGSLLPNVLPIASGRILLFVHGTFSNNDNLFAEFNLIPEGRQFLSDIVNQANQAGINYDQVLTLDHYTVSRSPVLNALELARMFSISRADIDIICHSRGGLVTRWFMEVFDRAPRGRRRVIFVGSPLRGTSLAAPARVRGGIDLFTNIGKAIGQGLSLIPFTQVAGSLMQIVFSVGNIISKTPLIDAAVAMIPGLAAMSRVSNNFELNALKDCPVNSPQYFGVIGTFKTEDVGWEFWKFWAACRRSGRLTHFQGRKRNPL